MMIKKALLATVAYVTFASNTAFAFDEVNWVWDSTVTDDINRTINVTVDSTPTGLVQIEKTQTQIGDLTAISNVTGIYNNAFGSSEGGPITVSVDDTFTLQSITDDSTDPNNIVASGPAFGDDNVLQSELLGGTLDEGTDELILDFRVFGEVTVDTEAAGTLDALDLPQVNSAATAVGNNQSIESNVSLALHDAQILSGTGETETAAVTALSTVSDILNASVNSSATAVGNNMDVTLAATAVDDGFMMADITQSSNANILAISSVSDITLNNYTNYSGAGMGPLGDPQTPLVNSVATAVGNNVAIKVSGPSL